MVVLPQFNQPLNTLTISFNYAKGSSGATCQLGYVTNASSSSSFTSLVTLDEPANVGNSSYSAFSKDLSTISSTPSSSSYRLALKYTKSSEDSWYFDNFSVTYTAPAVPTPITMQCGTTYSGTLGTSGVWNSYTSCSYSEPGEEKAYSYTAPITGSYTFRATATSGDPDFFLMSSLSNTGTNITGGCWSSGDKTVNLTAGTTYYLIVDNYSSSNTAGYTVSVDCPTCSVNVWTSGGGTVSGSGSYSYNTSCTATATPSSGYVFDSWILNGTQTITTNPYTFTVTGDTDLQAVFSTAHSITVSANPSNGGSASGGGTFTSGQSCTVSATPNSGYCFNNWTENGTEVSTNATYTFTVSGNRNLVANFASLDANSITVSGNSVVCGNSATLTASGLTGVTYNWYSDAACTQLVQANSATLTTPVLYDNATYYVKAVKGNAWEEVEQFPYTGSEQTYTVPANASYVKMEVWGAQGGYRSSSEYGGKGGYSVGTLTDLNGVQNLYVYVGGSGNTGRTSGGYNGGGSRDNYNGGGGATHIAKRSGLLSSLSSYQSDVLIVAGGGGSDGATNKNGMYGGGETGGSATQSYGSGGGGGTQTAGGVGSSSNTGTNGSFGQGGHGYNASSGYAGAGGGGWYGGAGSYPDSSSDDDRGGGGGSGHLNASLVEAQTIAGNATMPNPSGGDMTGREGNGYALITTFIDERCESEAKAVTVTVTPPDANSITVSGTSVACGNSTTLTAGGLTGVTYNWYSDAACTNLVQANSATLTTPVLTENTTYYVKAVKNNIIEQETRFSYTGSAQTYNVPTGAESLKLEVWGAEGGGQRTSGNTNSGYGGKGGYSVGTMPVSGGETLNVYVGGIGGYSSSGQALGGWNGGGTTYASSDTEPAAGGGGATDIRLNGTTLYNRIIVAGGGGGGGEDSSDQGGYGGGTSGGAGNSYSYQGTQTSAGNGGVFGIGASSTYDGGAGGGGWYGGGCEGGSQTIPTSNSSSDCGGGSGGSGYVWTSSTTSSAPSGYNVPDSYYLADAQTIAGNASMPNPNGGTMTGREGDGYARITAYINDACESDAKAVTITVTQPAAPTNVTVTADLTTATVTWDDNGESSWQYSIDNGATWATTLTPSAELSNLTMGTQYTFQVKAVNGDCESEAVSVEFTTTAEVTITKQILGYNENDNPNKPDGRWYLIASPLNTDIAPTAVTNMVAATAGDYDLFYFDQTASDGLEWRNYKQTSFSLVPGTGYLYANKYDVTLTFTGVPYQDNGAGQVSVDLTHTTGYNWSDWNLVGNPYNGNAFLDGPFYKMNPEGTEIVAVENNNRDVDAVIGPMEGVFVRYDEDEGYTAATFSTASTPSGAKVASLALNVTKDRGLVDRAYLSFGGKHSLPKFQLNPSHTKVYIPQDDKDYAVAIAESDMGELPVNFKAEKNGTYTFSVNAEEVRFGYLHLKDNKTGADVDLLETPSYTFEALSTDYASRFKLVFATGNATDDSFAFYSNGGFVISNDGDATLQVMDVTGRIVKSETLHGCSTVNVNAAPGVYMLRLVNGDNEKVQKVVVR